jgi:hypothetical protein
MKDVCAGATGFAEREPVDIRQAKNQKVHHSLIFFNPLKMKYHLSKDFIMRAAHVLRFSIRINTGRAPRVDPNTELAEFKSFRRTECLI